MYIVDTRTASDRQEFAMQDTVCLPVQVPGARSDEVLLIRNSYHMLFTNRVWREALDLIVGFPGQIHTLFGSSDRAE